MTKKFITLGYIFIVIAIIFCYFYLQTAGPGKPSEELKLFKIEKGQSFKEISENLLKEDFVKNKKLFEIYALLMNVKSRFQPGSYYLRPSISFKDLIQNLTSIPLPEEQTITILEGWQIKEIAEYLEKETEIRKEEFLKKTDELKNIDYEFLLDRPKNATLEGYLFPDTYRVYKKSTSEEIIKKMLENFNQKLSDELRAEIKKQNKTIFEILTMASLIEKEARTDLERRVISDIFWKRLEAKIPLQSCASINYILGVSKRRLSIEETRVPSPYNTYLNRGLPPGPINNPGINSIKAAIEPIKTDYWYFLSTEEGQTIFSRTKEEHDLNKAKYLK